MNTKLTTHHLDSTIRFYSFGFITDLFSHPSAHSSNSSNFFGTFHQSCRISTLSPSTSGCLSLSGVNAHVLNMLFGVTIYNIFRFTKHHRFSPHRCAFVRGTLWVIVPEALVLSVTSVHCFSKELLVSMGVGVAGGWPAKLFWPPFLPLGE